MLDPQIITLLIVILACILWITEWIPLYATSFVILFLELVWLLPSLNFNGKNISGDIFLNSFFSDTILLFLGGIVLSKAIHSYGIDKTLVYKLLNLSKGSPKVFLYSIVFCSSFLSFWMNNTSTAALMVGLCIPVLDSLPEYSGWRKAILLSIPFSCNVGGMATPIGSAPNAIALEYLNSKGVQLDFLTWMTFALPLVVLMNAIVIIFLIQLFCRKEKAFTLSLDTTSFKHTITDTTSQDLNRKRIFVLFVTVFTILMWLTAEFHGLSSGRVGLIPIIVFFGFGILDKKDFNQLSWDVLFLIGGGISLGRAMEHSGLARTIVQSLFYQETTFFLILLVFSVTTVVLSSIMSNTATANLLIPLAITAGGSEFSILVVVIALCASIAMPLPISTPPNAIAFGTGHLKAKEMVTSGSIITIFGLFFTISLGYYLIRLVFNGGLW